LIFTDQIYDKLETLQSKTGVRLWKVQDLSIIIIILIIIIIIITIIIIIIIIIIGRSWSGR